MGTVLSICIPTWNRKNEIERALKMVAKEAAGIEDQIEVCVSNNGSSDGTKEYLEEAKGKLKFSLKVFHSEKNQGFDKNVLTVLEMGSGDWLWLFGDDDIINEKKLLIFVKLLKNMEEDVSVVFPNVQWIPPGKSVPNPPVDTAESIKLKDTSSRSLFFSPQSYITRVVIKRSLFSQLKHWELEDYTGNVEMHMWIQRYIGDEVPKIQIEIPGGSNDTGYRAPKAHQAFGTAQV
ncbi:MAG: glycosyltransferase family 2 protein, partial [Candidatus Micrarchaeota archaeon]